MEIKFGETCPKYNWVKANCNKDIDQLSPCLTCQGLDYIGDGYLVCKYSEVPTIEPKYKIGQIVFSSDDYAEKLKVRSATWDGFKWRYKVSRKQSERSEDVLFETKKEAYYDYDKRDALRGLKIALKFIKDYKDKALLDIKKEFPDIKFNNLIENKQTSDT